MMVCSCTANDIESNLSFLTSLSDYIVNQKDKRYIEGQNIISR